MSRGLSTQWTKHLKTEKERQDFGDLVRNSTQVLTRLQDMIREGGASDERHVNTDEFFSNPNWANAQAFHMGKRCRDTQLLAILSFLDQ